jgi:hypothetical protein
VVVSIVDRDLSTADDSDTPWLRQLDCGHRRTLQDFQDPNRMVEDWQDSVASVDDALPSALNATDHNHFYGL